MNRLRTNQKATIRPSLSQLLPLPFPPLCPLFSFDYLPIQDIFASSSFQCFLGALKQINRASPFYKLRSIEVLCEIQSQNRSFSQKFARNSKMQRKIVEKTSEKQVNEGQPSLHSSANPSQCCCPIAHCHFQQVSRLFRIIIKIQNSIEGMRMCLSFKQLIKMGDFFNSYQMLRYEKQTEYRTFTGGLISIGIIITILISFASMIMDTINRTSINFTENTQRNVDPTLSTITVSPENNFMFGVEVWGYNLSSENRIFDVVFTQIQSTYGENYTNTHYPLQKCTPEHWAMLPSVVESFDKLHVGYWLCPTIGTIINLRGKYSSGIYNQYSVTLYPCNNATDPNRPCAPAQAIDQFFQANGQWNYFSYYYVNSVVNPQQTQYKSYYLQDRTYIVFGPNMGAELDMYLSEIDITTDSSIWPFSSIQSDTLYSIDFSPILYTFAVNSNTSFATFYVMKDPADTSIDRSVEKIFVICSFMGGLIGAVMAALFMMNSYTSFAYELALALQLFKQNENSETHKDLKKSPHNSVNLFHYVQYYFYIFLKKVLGSQVEWSFAKYLDECRDEVRQQLDVKGLIKRLIFLEYAISYLLEDFHIAEMQLKRPTSPLEVKWLRHKIQATEALEEYEVMKGSNASLVFSKQDCVKEKQEETAVETIIHNPYGEKLSKKRVSVPRSVMQEDIIKQTDSDLSDNKVGNEFHSKEVKVKKRTIQLRKLRVSAQMGNDISKKLLQVVGLKKEQTEISQISDAECLEMLNIANIPKRKISQI